ncbi:MAG: M81 family metallopeptidase [Thermomicrobiales bacterium]|nr:M81 family metallopeptidase [Thermomicrobiales bacterium]
MTRVAVGGISQETNTFSPQQTTLSDFQCRTLVRGQALIDGSRGASTALGGIVDTALALHWEIEPLLFASATPGGRVRRGVFEALTNELVGGIAVAQASDDLDGVLLALHGAMVSDGLEDADGEILRRVRKAVGPGVPIVVVLDSHANLTAKMVAAADILLAYETYPHIDTYARGSQAVRLMERLRRGDFRPVHALRQMPLLSPLTAQRTDGATPMAELAEMAVDLRRERDVVAITLTPGFPYSDIRDAGMAVLVTTNADERCANELADRLADACWERRSRFVAELTPVREAVAQAMAAEHRPVVLADVADNPGAGGTGSETAILQALLDARAVGSVVATIADERAVRQAATIGAGQRGVLRLGAAASRSSGPVREIAAFVRWVGDLSFAGQGPMGAGTTTRLGPSAVIEVGDPPVEVILSSNRVQSLDPQLLRSVGIAPEERRIIALKSSVHFRAAFEPLAAAIIEVDGPGRSSPNIQQLPYRRVRRPIWPLDCDVM